jgi:hypothetical protein
MILGRAIIVSGTTTLLALAACSSGSASGTAGAGDLASFASSYCSLIEPCCAAAGLPATGTGCRTLLTVIGGQHPYDAAKGEACIAAAQQASTSPGFCTDLGGSSVSAVCNGVVGGSGSTSGTAQPGQACQTDTDCAPAAGTGGGAACLMQTCVQTTMGVAGDAPCIGTMNGNITEYMWTGTPPSTAYVCNVANGVACDGTAGACVAQQNVGATCTQDVDCVSTGYCAFNTVAGTSQCTARLPDGSPCGGTTGAECLSTSSCDMTTSTCKARSPDGAPCTLASTCVSYLCSNGKCGANPGLALGLFCSQ